MDREYCPECGCEMDFVFDENCWYCETCGANYTHCPECEQWYPTDNGDCDYCGWPHNDEEDE